ncbi:uncharacterized protein K452DRAFT_282487 [Aplosporella prunicola CBS 121167]|uniref:Uncharacterized protein n=1 Tax=Aplosporella prunicola CBS 121167 TaxID=1176127 RepID=A0A6A6BTN9_9PEZI|nr:uncharacterized protein K452DRAFT_282487 [Aplosporella prunicola CBS 121167]KAF2147482.1 hypothetical protein K452DRAFT_282487 [Aplosporella prunicola CBS 121167]
MRLMQAFLEGVCVCVCAARSRWAHPRMYAHASPAFRNPRCLNHASRLGKTAT